jgi:uncharacterized protein (DUF433 family)
MDTNPDGHIVKTPGVCGEKPRIAGHRIRVQDIVVLHEQQGQSPDEIVSAYPQLIPLAVKHIYQKSSRFIDALPGFP